MRLLGIGDVPSRGLESRFGHRPWGALVLLAMTLAFVAVPVVLSTRGGGLLNGSLPWWAWVVIGPVALVALLIWLVVLNGCWRSVLACFRRSSNWVMVVAFGGLYVQFRSYLNHHFPADMPTVVYIPWDDIATAGKTLERTPSVDSDGNAGTQVRPYLELRLKHTDTEALRQAVAEETARKPNKTGRSFIRFHHVPVQVPEPGVIRIEWRGRRMLKALRSKVEIASTVRRGHEIADTPAKDDRDGLILRLIEQGDRMAAIRTVRGHYGMSLAEARRFVDDLAQGQAKVSVSADPDRGPENRTSPDVSRPETCRHA